MKASYLDYHNIDRLCIYFDEKYLGLNRISELRSRQLVYMHRTVYFHYRVVYAVAMDNSNQRHVIYESTEKLAGFAIMHSQSSSTYADCCFMQVYFLFTYTYIYIYILQPRIIRLTQD